jgi:tetratricopeptide (TPR) repeat protein
MAQLKSLSMLPLCLIVSLTFWLSSAFPDAPTDTVFTQALESFKQSDLAKSRENFQQLLQSSPNDPVLLYNAGLVEFSDQHPGRAMAYWRKALFLRPGFSPALTAINQLEKQKNPAIIPAQWWQKGPRYVSLSWLLGTLLIFTSFSVVFNIRRQRAKKLQLSVPPIWPVISGLVFSVFLVGLIALHASLLHWHTMATVLETVSIHSSPNSESPALFDFKEGDEVIIHRQNGDWLQIQRGSTAIGWVQKAAIFVHSGPALPATPSSL